MPAGMPPQNGDDADGDEQQQQQEEALPPGHPATGGGGMGADPHGGQDPHGGGGGGGAGMPGVFQPPPDSTDEQPALPAGTIIAMIVDADEHPIPNAMVTLGIVNNSVAKGESRQHKTAKADANGTVRFDHLEVASQIAYRVTVPLDGATFAANPFRLPVKGGMAVRLHIYPVVHDIEQALIVTQAIVYVEMKDDRVQVQEALSIWNFGKVTWVPDNVTVNLPANFTAFNAQQGMTDAGVDLVEKVGYRVRGTFPPGRNDIEFKWQLPYDGERDVSIDVGMTPHLAAARVMAPASRAMQFSATGFPPAQARTDNQGQRILISEKQLTRGEAPMTTVHLELRDLPVAGPGRYIATSLAGAGVMLGIVLSVRSESRGKRSKKESRALRDKLLFELEDLERGRITGDVGPQTYERARRELIDQIAMTYAPETV